MGALLKSSSLARFRGFVSEHKLGIILTVGVVVRLVLMPISAHPFDMYVWYDAALSIVKNGPLSVHFFPPVQGYFLLIPLAYLYNWLVRTFSWGSFGPISMASISPALNYYPSLNALYVPGMLFSFIEKVPLLFSDFFATILLYKIVLSLTGKKGLAETAAILWFLNPYLIWVSSVWGMWDTLPALFSLACLYFLLKKKFVLSSVCLMLGIFLKVYPLLFLLPITFYILRTSAIGDRLKNLAKFYSVIIIPSILLLATFSGSITTFLTQVFLAGSNAVTGIVTNPSANSLGLGLTYWTLFGPDRLVNYPLTSVFVSTMMILSTALVLSFVTLSYLRISKMGFQKPAYDLSAALLFCVFAFFLSFRIIDEQYFVWALPFLIILFIETKIKTALYWFASFIALFYVILNCPLPLFFLPLSPWAANSLVSFLQIFRSIQTIRVILLAILGCLFSAVTIFALIQINRQIKQ
jgi:Gpi18-like mannosyltransferase